MLRPALACLWLFGAGVASAADGAGLPDFRSDPYILLRTIQPPDAAQDDLAAAGPLTMHPYPADGQVVRQTPPVFRWPFDSGQAAWQIRIDLPDGASEDRVTADNWVFLDRPLPPGRYAWQVRPWGRQSGAGAWSAARHFIVPEGAHEFIMPAPGALFRHAENRTRPRSLPTGIRQILSDDRRKTAFVVLLERARTGHLAKEIPEEPAAVPDGIEDRHEKIRLGRKVASTVYREALAVREIAYAWFGSGDGVLLENLKARLRNLAGWSLDGATGFAANDTLSREISLTLAIALDLSYAELSVTERRRIVDSIVARTQPAFDRYVYGNGQPPLRQNPFNSHGFNHAGAISAIALLLAGDSQRARQWFEQTFPVLLATGNAWGGDDGGFANSTQYAGWNLAAFLRNWDIIEAASGVPLLRTVWPQEAGLWLNYFAPPGTPRGIFGDGSERDMSEVWRRIGHELAQRVPRAFNLSYARGWSAEPPSSARLAFGPLASNKPETVSVPLPDAAIFPSIGWTAMHSDLTDPQRSSIYFLASPFGSHNHSHAAQNSFVLHARGRPLAVASGYYDFYGSEHHANWTRSTQAQNAITFDGGKGQAWGDMQAAGRIVSFGHGEALDHVTGDATKAYRGALSKATRTLAYLRQQDMVVVLDDLAALVPRQWEWNIHALHEMQLLPRSGLKIAEGDASLCVDMLHAPDSRLGQNDRYPDEPDRFFGEMPSQWHAAYTSSEKTTSARFLALLRIGCKPAGDVAVDTMADGFRLTGVFGRLKIDDRGATLE